MLRPLISQRLRTARISAGLTAQAGISHTTVVRSEQGHTTPTLATLQALSEALGVSVASLTEGAP